MNTAYSLTSKFQVTIPKELREQIGLLEHDRVSFERRGSELVLKKVASVEDVAAEMAAKFKASGLKPASDADIKGARCAFHAQGMQW